jgi:cell division cycle protein 20 (cofactor of APC complex)
MDTYFSPPTTPTRRKSGSFGININSDGILSNRKREKNINEIEIKHERNSIPKRLFLNGENNEFSSPYSSPKKNKSKDSQYDSLSPSSKSSADRFIPNRLSIDFDKCNHLLNQTFQDENIYLNSPEKTIDNKSNIRHSEHILQTMSNVSDKRLASCFEKSLSSSSSSSIIKTNNFQEILENRNSLSSNSIRKNMKRILPSEPSHVLDAPDLKDDYYLNLLHWSSSNIIAVALNQSVYLWHALDGRIDKLTTLENSDDYITSVQWSATDNSLAVGTSGNIVELWDASRLTKIRDLLGHSSRVSSLSWNGNSISSGGRDSMIINHDIRSARNIQSRYIGHQQEVCGLSWSPDGSTLASGGNENLLCLWDAAMSSRSNNRGLSESNTYSPRIQNNDHTAAVKALAWCPWERNVVASGGGTVDKTLRIWNSTNGSNIKCVDTGSQVCAIQWSDTQKELVSSHGFSDNQLILWKYPSMTKIQEFRGHTSRVLHLAKSPDGATICSASADETIRFWNLFGTRNKSNSIDIGKTLFCSSGGITGHSLR